ncbi:hypothetical protein YPPY12_0170, partial [Yersinia pestis PY-12]
MDKKW